MGSGLQPHMRPTELFEPPIQPHIPPMHPAPLLLIHICLVLRVRTIHNSFCSTEAASAAAPARAIWAGEASFREASMDATRKAFSL